MENGMIKSKQAREKIRKRKKVGKSKKEDCSLICVRVCLCENSENEKGNERKKKKSEKVK